MAVSKQVFVFKKGVGITVLWRKRWSAKLSVGSDDAEHHKLGDDISDHDAEQANASKRAGEGDDEKRLFDGARQSEKPYQGMPRKAPSEEPNGAK